MLANENENLANSQELEKILLSKVKLANENEHLANSHELEKYCSVFFKVKLANENEKLASSQELRKILLNHTCRTMHVHNSYVRVFLVADDSPSLHNKKGQKGQMAKKASCNAKAIAHANALDFFGFGVANLAVVAKD